MWQTSALRQAGRPDRRLVKQTPVGGGCISQTSLWTLDDGEQLFAKIETPARLPMLIAEADGLRALAAAEQIRVPQVWAVGSSDDQQVAFLLSEFIVTHAPNKFFYESLGQQLAALHRVPPQQPGYGWQQDNFLGATPQPNTFHSQWVDFVAEQRLGYQLRCLVDRQLAGSRLRNDLNRIISRLGTLLPNSSEPPSLLHGDLWSGNYLADPQRQPVLIDPAVYLGDREAEFGMIELFGSCPPAFYEAYQATYPLREGWRERTDVYILYHLLNHLNLFGSSYAVQCESLARRIAGRT